MDLYDRLQKLSYLCSLIRRKATGTPGQLAEKLQISRATVYKLIQELESFGAEIEYNRIKRTFVFVVEVDISVEVEKKHS